MKILKLKSILFSLMAVLTVTVFLSSCEKDSDLNKFKSDKENAKQQSFQEEMKYFSEETYLIETLPGMSEEESIEWINSLTYEEVKSNSKNQELESRSCGPWQYVMIKSTKYLGCTCPSSIGRYKEIWIGHRFCSDGVEGNKNIVKYVCKNYC